MARQVERPPASAVDVDHPMGALTLDAQRNRQLDHLAATFDLGFDAGCRGYRTDHLDVAAGSGRG